MKYIIRIYTPKDPFHARKTYIETRYSGAWYLHIAFSGWEIMLGKTEIAKNEDMPLFMWVEGPEDK